MTTAAGSSGHLDVSGVFEATSEIYKKCFGTVWIVALVLLVPAGLIVALLGDGSLSILGRIIQLVATAWLAGGVIRVVQDVEQSGKVDWSVGEILSSVTPKLIGIILLQIVLGILITIGIFFLIVPGVILALIWAVAMPSLVVEDEGVFDSMSRSSDLTRDNRMRILAVGLVIVAAYFVIGILGVLLVLITPIIAAIILIIVGVLLYPYVSIIQTVLYYRLVELKEGGVAAAGPQEAINDPGQAPPAV